MLAMNFCDSFRTLSCSAFVLSFDAYSETRKFQDQNVCNTLIQILKLHKTSQLDGFWGCIDFLDFSLKQINPVCFAI